MQDDEETLTLTQAAKKCPGRPHVSTLWRACRKGIRAADGTRVHLEHTRFGKRIFTTREAVARFGARLVQADLRHFAPKPIASPQPRTTSDSPRRGHEIATAEETLRRAGL